jgi:hypothetical protein
MGVMWVRLRVRGGGGAGTMVRLWVLVVVVGGKEGAPTPTHSRVPRTSRNVENFLKEVALMFSSQPGGTHLRTWAAYLAEEKKKLVGGIEESGSNREWRSCLPRTTAPQYPILYLGIPCAVLKHME